VMRAARRFRTDPMASAYLSPAYPEISVQEFNRSVHGRPMVSIAKLEADNPPAFLRSM
jgi:hypothetical protein